MESPANYYDNVTLSPLEANISSRPRAGTKILNFTIDTGFWVWYLAYFIPIFVMLGIVYLAVSKRNLVGTNTSQGAVIPSSGCLVTHAQKSLCMYGTDADTYNVDEVFRDNRLSKKKKDSTTKTLSGHKRKHGITNKSPKPKKAHKFKEPKCFSPKIGRPRTSFSPQLSPRPGPSGIQAPYVFPLPFRAHRISSTTSSDDEYNSFLSAVST